MFADINGTRLFFDVEGSGYKIEKGELKEKPVCFLLHGGPGGTHLGFRPHFSQLADDIQFVYIDNRGSGFSGKGHQSTYNLENNVEDIEALRKYLGLEKICLLGHSYGGMVAMSYAIKYQENLSGLLLLTTSPSYEFINKAKLFIETNGTEAQKEIAQLALDGKFESDEQLITYYEIMAPLYSVKAAGQANSHGAIPSSNRSYEALNEGFSGFLKEFDLREELKAIHVPTLIMAGRHDWITPVADSETIASLIPHNRFIVFEKSSHNVIVDETDLFLKEVKEFINQTARSASEIRA